MPPAEVEQAAALFNQAWDFLDMEERAPADDESMLSVALESRNLWRQHGTAKNHAISDWLVSRVYAVLGEGSTALAFGEMSLAQCEAHQLGPFLTGYGHEAIARSHAVSGEFPLARRHIHQATIQAGRISEIDERSMLDDDLADIEHLFSQE